MTPRKPKATVTVVLTEKERDAIVTSLWAAPVSGPNRLTMYGQDGYEKLRRARVARRKA